MIKVKNGVEIKKLTPEMLNVIDKVVTVWNVEADGVIPVITSAFDSAPDRVENTKHKVHQAFDLRTRDLKHLHHVEHLAQGLRRALGNNYDIVVEKDHIHVEYDPR